MTWKNRNLYDTGIMTELTGIIDYRAGNIKSVERACAAIGARYVISRDPRELQKATRLIFPGVGEAAYAMQELKKSGFDRFLRDSADAGIPLLGICLGAQIVFDYSEEGGTECLGLIPGVIRRFPEERMAAQGLKIPHMGWNDITLTAEAGNGPQDGAPFLFAGVPDGTDFYFVHSYYMDPENKSHVSAWADYGGKFAAAVRHGCIQALQFHPEKSGRPGLRILANFTGAKGGAPC